MSMQRRLVHIAKQLRRNQTSHEVKLWRLLRDRRFEGYKFRRQFPIGPYISDFCCLEKKLIVEVDGGGHAEQKATLLDRQRDEYFRSSKFTVLRVWNNEVDHNVEGVYQRIMECLTSPLTPRRASPARGEAVDRIDPVNPSPLTRSAADRPLPPGERQSAGSAVTYRPADPIPSPLAGEGDSPRGG